MRVCIVAVIATHASKLYGLRFQHKRVETVMRQQRTRSKKLFESFEWLE